MKHILITGGTGFIGSTLAERLREEGHKVLIAGRDRSSVDVYYNIVEDFKFPKSLHINVVIHLAFSKVNTKNTKKLEVKSAKKLLTWCHKVGALFIFLSSQSAHKHASSFYGLAKLQIEEAIAKSGGTIIVPPLVVGDKASPLIFSIFQRLDKLPLKPVFLPSPKIQICRLEIVIEYIFMSLGNDPKSLTKTKIKDGINYDLNSLIDALFDHNESGLKVKIPIPLIIIFTLNKLLVKFGFHFKSFTDLHTLHKTQFDNTLLAESSSFPMQHILTFKKRTFRPKLKESMTIFKYLGIKHPTHSMYRKYIHMLKSDPALPIFCFPRLIVCFPSILYLYDLGKFQRNADLVERFSFASTITSLDCYAKSSHSKSGHHKNNFVFLASLIAPAIIFMICIPIGMLVQLSSKNIKKVAQRDENP